jgi:hypothetical protein
MAKAAGGQTTRTPTKDEMSRKNIGAALLEKLSALNNRKTRPKMLQKMSQKVCMFSKHFYHELKESLPQQAKKWHCRGA